MNKLSFASVYRTAAILAAFSRADGPSDAPPQNEGARPALRRPVGTSAWASIGRSLLAWVGRARAWSPVVFRQAAWMSDQDLRRVRSWTSQRGVAAMTTPAVAEPGRPLVSHFSFCEDADPHRSGTKP